MTDNLPEEVAVITDSIRVDGIFTNGLYITDTHQIHFEASGSFNQTFEVEIIFQVQVRNEIPFWTEIENQLNGQATINGELIFPENIPETSTRVVSPNHKELYLPVIIHQN